MSHPGTVHIALIAALVASMAWGALAFGAVYPWAFGPLALASALVGLTALLTTKRGRPPAKALAIALIVAGLAIGAQLLPLPAGTSHRVSPNRTDLLVRHEARYGVIRSGTEESQPAGDASPQSIDPVRTALGLALFASLAVLLLGAARLLSHTGGLAVARPLVVLGILLALIGIGQWALTRHVTNPLIYGFWKPRFEARPFGPFVNPNHFAGWMLMTLPIVLALCYESLQRAFAAVRDRESRWSLIGVPEFGQAMTFGFSAVVMALALMMTRSRSGLAAFGIGSLLAGWILFRRQRTVAGRLTAIVVVVALMGGAGLWAGVDTAAGKTTEDQTGDSLGGRMDAWRDTLRIIQAFPVAGTGFNTYGKAMTVYQTGPRRVHFQEAHNEYLQIAAEGGLLVGIPVLAVLAMFVRDVRRRFREAPKEGTTYWLRVGAVIGLISIAAQSSVEFSLQMPGNAVLFAVLGAIALHQSPNLRNLRK